MAEFKLKNEVVLPVMKEFNISREEAEKRITLLLESGILQSGKVVDPETRKMVTIF